MRADRAPRVPAVEVNITNDAKTNTNEGCNGLETRNPVQESTGGKKNIAEIIDSDAMNLVLLASRDPRAALSRIGTLVQEAKHDLRVGEHNRAFAKLNKIGWLSGRLA